MRKKYSLIIAVGLLASFVACDKADEDKLLRESSIYEPTQTGYSAYIAEPCEGFLQDGVPSTKAISTDFKFSFSSGDKFNVFPDTFDASLLYKLNPEESDKTRAVCEPESVTMADGTWYAVYPSIIDPNKIDGNTIILSFSDQKQTGNGNSDHLAKYDYNWAKAEVEGNKGLFEFSHKVSWLKITLTNANKNKTFSSITIRASNGIAEKAKLDASGVMTYTKPYGDALVLSLENCTKMDRNTTLTAYVTIPSDTYTNLTIKTSDQSGTNYGYQVQGSKTLEAGKYYSVKLSQTFVPDPVPDPDPEKPAAFTDITEYGSYKNTDSAAEHDFVYSTPNDQISYGTGTNSRTCKIFNIENNIYNIFTIGSKNLSLNSDYSVSLNSSVSTRDNEGTFKVKKLTETCVWLEDNTKHIGYILPIE